MRKRVRETRDECHVDEAPRASPSDSGSGLDDLDKIEGTDVPWDEFLRARPLDIDRFLIERQTRSHSAKGGRSSVLIRRLGLFDTSIENLIMCHLN
jgi:hypothetical protein